MHIALIPTTNPAQSRPWFPPADTCFDYEAAHKEGWTVSEAAPAAPGEPGVQLQRLDNPETGQTRFADDRDAWAHVVRQARAGSSLHRQALELVDDIERMLIEAVHGIW